MRDAGGRTKDLAINAKAALKSGPSRSGDGFARAYVPLPSTTRQSEIDWLRKIEHELGPPDGYLMVVAIPRTLLLIDRK